MCFPRGSIPHSDTSIYTSWGNVLSTRGPRHHVDVLRKYEERSLVGPWQRNKFTISFSSLLPPPLSSSPPHTLTSSPSHTHLLVVIISEGRHTLPWGTIIRLDLWPHWNGQHLQNRISVVVWGDRGQTDRRTCKQINRWWTDREERVMLHYLSILGVPGEVAEGLGQADIVALLKEGKSFHAILQREIESKD